MENKAKLNIAGVDLILNTSEDPKYMESIGEEINTRVREITRNSTYISTTMASILTALEFCDNQKKNFKDIAKLEEEIQKLETEITELRLESDEARREIDRINSENQKLRANLSRR